MPLFLFKYYYIISIAFRFLRSYIKCIINIIFKIIIHHPHGGMSVGRAQRSQAHGEVSELNLSQAVIALEAGPIKPDCARDMLLIGSPTQILGNFNKYTIQFNY